MNTKIISKFAKKFILTNIGVLKMIGGIFFNNRVHKKCLIVTMLTISS
jgi:hypothetical protein